MTPDLIVIGAGPAGLAAAIAAARHGIPTLVLEKRPLPIDKPCGEGLLPNGVDALLRLGVRAEDLERGGARLRGIRYITAAGRCAESTFPAGYGLGMRRVCLSEVLASRARQEDALEIRTGVPATIEWTSAGSRVMAGDATWRPRLVIGADGLHSRVRSAVGIATDQHARKRWGVRRHVSGAAWSDFVEVYFGRGFEAYVTPVRDGVNIAWLWGDDAAREAGEADRPAVVGDRFLAQMPALAARLSARETTDRAEGAGPFHQRPRERARTGVLLMGDAAGYLDPLTGEGVGLALTQAELFETFVVPLLRTPGHDAVPESAFGPYLRAVDSATRSNRDLTRLMLFLARKPWLVERVVAGLAGNPALFAHGLDANMGRTNLWSVPPSSLLRLPIALFRSPR